MHTSKTKTGPTSDSISAIKRFEHPELAERLNDLYPLEWNLYFNFFIPSVKLIAKTRVGFKTVKTHDPPKTPVQRLLESDHIPAPEKKPLRETFDQVNPFELQHRMSDKIKHILRELDRLGSDHLPQPQGPALSPYTLGPAVNSERGNSVTSETL